MCQPLNSSIDATGKSTGFGLSSYVFTAVIYTQKVALMLQEKVLALDYLVMVSLQLNTHKK